MQSTITLGAMLWAAMLPAAAYAATIPVPSRIGEALAFIVYGIGSFVCHQQSARSFHLWGAQLPVCARCTGIYVGAALACAVSSAARMTRSSVTAAVIGRASLDDVRIARRVLCAAALPTAATLIYEWTSGSTPGNWVRAAAAFPLGFSIGALVLGQAAKR